MESPAGGYSAFGHHWYLWKQAPPGTVRVPARHQLWAGRQHSAGLCLHLAPPRPYIPHGGLPSNHQVKSSHSSWDQHGGPPGSCRPQMGPMFAPWTLLSGKIAFIRLHTRDVVLHDRLPHKLVPLIFVDKRNPYVSSCEESLTRIISRISNYTH